MLPSFESKRNNGIPNFSTVSKPVLYSVIWLLCSLLLIFFGIYHCYSNSRSFDFKCSRDSCSLIRNGDRSNEIEFFRQDLLSSTVVRLNPDQKSVKEPLPKNSRARGTDRGYPHSIEVVVTRTSHPYNEHQSHIVLNYGDIGTRFSENADRKIQSFIDGGSDKLNLKYSYNFTLTGLLSFLIGLVSLLLVCAIGEWVDSSPRRMKKRS